MPLWILELLGSKYFWIISAALAVVTGTYLKGRKDANASNAADQQEAKENQENDIKQAEKENQKADKEGADKVQDINGAPNIGTVIDILNGFFKKGK